jgi:hypothetical protein
VAADQRRDVAAAVRELGPDVAAVAERVGLARDVVERRLAELGG